MSAQRRTRHSTRHNTRHNTRHSTSAVVTPRQRAAQVEAQVTALTEQLHAAVRQLCDGPDWAAMLRVAGSFHRYSYRNMLLLWMQAHDRDLTLTQVAGHQAWRRLGRTVRKGERGLKVLAPIRRRLSEDEAAALGPRGYDATGRPAQVLRGVRIAHVFNLSQTDGEPLPQGPAPAYLTGEDTAGLWARLAELVAGQGYRIERRVESGETQGWTRYSERLVSVRPDIDGAHAVAVLAHELGHILAEHETRHISREQRETEAESIAYVVLTGCGIDPEATQAAAAPYVAGWSGGDPEVITAAVATVHRVAATVLRALRPQTSNDPGEDEDGPEDGTEHGAAGCPGSDQVA
jgi:antirestriction protein ArdC